MSESQLPTAQDREMFRDALRGFLEKTWSAEHAAAWAHDPRRLREAATGLARQGLTAIGTDPAAGGAAEAMLAMQELGRACCRAPVSGSMIVNLATRGSKDRALAQLKLLWVSGEARLSVALAGRAVTWADGHITGTVDLVESAHAATHIAIVAGDALAIVACGDERHVEMSAQPAMDQPEFVRVSLEAAAATRVEIGAEATRDLMALGQLAGSARALGAAQRAFDLAVAYAKERVQFGKPVGGFQAIQHKLANCHVALRAAQLSIENAALRHDADAGDWRWYAAAATALANGSLRQVALEIQHVFGAIGYCEEHEAPRHFRSVHVDTLMQGGARTGGEELAAHFLDQGRGFPACDLGAAGNAFRAEVRAWLAQHWGGERKRAHDAKPFHEREFDPRFALDLGQTGWIGLAWPERFGGQDRSALDQLAFIEEMERADAPRTGAPVQALMLQEFGTREQQARYLPEILRGEAMFGMGYSEPQAGSDLAALNTRAERDGDHYVINGQKIWTTTYWGRYMLLATRTQPRAQPPHAGISMFIVPMDSPGITVRPSTTMYGGTFANIFYDDVRVPADALVGAEGEGWKVLTGALATERGLVGGGIALRIVHLFELLCAEIREHRPLAADLWVRSRIGELGARIEAARQMMLACARALDEGHLDLADAAVSKVYSSELLEAFCEAAQEILGSQALISQGGAGALLNGRLEQALRHSLMWVISIGTNEIQRNLIAQRALGLPR